MAWGKAPGSAVLAKFIAQSLDGCRFQVELLQAGAVKEMQGAHVLTIPSHTVLKHRQEVDRLNPWRGNGRWVASS